MSVRFDCVGSYPCDELPPPPTPANELRPPDRKDCKQKEKKNFLFFRKKELPCALAPPISAPRSAIMFSDIRRFSQFSHSWRCWYAANGGQWIVHLLAVLPSSTISARDATACCTSGVFFCYFCLPHARDEYQRLLVMAFPNGYPRLLGLLLLQSRQLVDFLADGLELIADVLRHFRRLLGIGVLQQQRLALFQNLQSTTGDHQQITHLGAKRTSRTPLIFEDTSRLRAVNSSTFSSLELFFFSSGAHSSAINSTYKYKAGYVSIPAQNQTKAREHPHCKPPNNERAHAAHIPCGSSCPTRTPLWQHNNVRLLRNVSPCVC